MIRQPGEQQSDKLTVWALTAARDCTGYSLGGWSKQRTSTSGRLLINSQKGYLMNNIVYIVGAIVIVIAVLSFFGLR